MAVSAAVKYEVRWRITGTEQWSDIMDCSPVGEIVVEGLDRTKPYDFEVRAVSACGAKSDWGTSSNTVPSSAPPLAIASLTAQSLADGVHLAWDTSGVQPAGIEYSLERSSLPTSGFVERVRVRGTAYTDPETSGSVFYYRVRAVNYVEAYGAYSPVVSSNGVNVSAIGSTATTASSLATQVPIINPNFNATPAGYGWTADAGSNWVTDLSAVIAGGAAGAAKHVGTGSAVSGSYRNVGRAACVPGQVVKYQALIQAIGADGYCTPTISFQNASGTEITSAAGSLITGTTTTPVSFTAVAPAGTVKCVFQLTVAAHSAGTYLCDNLATNMQPASLDEVPDGPSFARTLANQLVNGTIPPPSVGDNICPNPSFELNSCGATLNSAYYSGRLCDNWVIGENAPGGGYGIIYTNGDTSRTQGGVNRLTLALPSGVSIPNGGQVYVGAWTDKQIPVTAGDTFYIYGYIFSDTAAAPPAGVNVSANIYLRYYSASGAYINQTGISYTGTDGSMASPLSGTSVVPSNASYAVVYCLLVAKNSSGAAVTSYGGWRVPSFDGITINKKTALETVGSGRTVGDQRNLLTRTVANIPALLPTSISYSYISGSTSSVPVSISVAAFTMLGGSYNVAYNAMSTSIVVPRPSTTTIYLYFDDPAQAGGTPTLIATTNKNDVYGGDGRVYVGGVVVTVVVSSPGSGTGGTGGSSGCVCTDQWLPGDVQAGDVGEGDAIEGTEGDLVTRSFCVDGARINLQPCWRLVTDSGASVSASESTPMTLPGGKLAMFPDMLGEMVAVRRGDHPAQWERVTHMRYLGIREVNQISIGGNCYWAGDQRSIYVSTHNTAILPK